MVGHRTVLRLPGGMASGRWPVISARLEPMGDHPRNPCIPIRQRIWCEGDNVTLYVQALNVSTGGLFVRTANPPHPGQRFRVSFTDLDEGEVVAQVEVVWARHAAGDPSPGMGLRIVTFERGADNFQRFVERKEIASRTDDGEEPS